MTALFNQTRAKFLQASRKGFADWGEANNHRQVGGAISEFYELFVVHSSYYEPFCSSAASGISAKWSARLRM
jgi:hypothetical protein